MKRVVLITLLMSQAAFAGRLTDACRVLGRALFSNSGIVDFVGLGTQHRKVRVEKDYTVPSLETLSKARMNRNTRERTLAWNKALDLQFEQVILRYNPTTQAYLRKMYYEGLDIVKQPWVDDVPPAHFGQVDVVRENEKLGFRVSVPSAYLGLDTIKRIILIRNIAFVVGFNHDLLVTKGPEAVFQANLHPWQPIEREGVEWEKKIFNQIPLDIPAAEMNSMNYIEQIRRQELEGLRKRKSVTLPEYLELSKP